MLRAFRSEWLKLRRRGLLAAAGLLIVFSGLSVVLSTTTTGAAAGRHGRGGSALTIADLARVDGYPTIFSRGATFVGVVALAIAAYALATEYSWGTIRVLLVRQPRRLRLLAGKVVAVLGFVVGAAAIAYLICLPIALAILGSRGIPTDEWFTAEGLGEIAAGLGRSSLAPLGWGAIGVFLGVVLRSPAPALAVGVAYVVPLENLVAVAWDEGEHWLPGQLLASVASGGTGDVSLGWAASMLLLYLGAMSVAGAILFRRQDITA